METNYSDHSLICNTNNRNVYYYPGDGTYYAVMTNLDARYYAIPGSAFSPYFSTKEEAIAWKPFPSK